MAMGPGQELAEQLIARLTEDERSDLKRWCHNPHGNETKQYLTGYLHGRFCGEYSLMALANAARAIADYEAKL